MQIGSLPPRPSPREAGGGRGGEERGRGRGPGRGRAGEGAARSSEEGLDWPPALPAGQGAAGRVCSLASGLLRAGAPRLLLLLLLPPAACMRSSRAGILRAPHPAGSPGRPPAPPLGLAPPSGAERAGRGTPGTGEPHSDTGGPAWPPPLAGPAAPRSSAAAPRVRAVRCTCSSAGPQPTLG